MLTKKVHRYIFLLSTSLIIIGLPISFFILSLAQLLLAANWFAEGNLAQKFKSIISRKSITWIVLIYLVHLIGLLNTSNFSYAFHDLRIKLPLLALPLIYGTSPPLSRKEFKAMLQLFILTVLVGSFISAYVLLGFSEMDPIDSRYASLFISHIRFSLIVVLSIYSIFYIALFSHFKLVYWEKWIYSVVSLWLIMFLVLLKSFTGIVIFIFLIPVALVWWSVTMKNKRVIRLSYAGSFLLILLIVLYGYSSYKRFNERILYSEEQLESYTVNGNRYTHKLNSDEYENSYPIWVYLSEKELKQEWNTRSKYQYDSLDRRGQSIRSTLIRYMTSMGYRKDSLGVLQLSSTDIKMIEKGYTNCLQKKKFSLYPRIYELLWELKRYNASGDPNAQSLTQRIEYMKTGIHILQNHFLLGVGTGDVNDEYLKQYVSDNSLLKPRWQNRAHNQFLTFFITFGVFGFIIILFALFYPPYIEQKYHSFLFFVFFLIGFLSMLNEDTLETHVGVSFFAFFYSFLLFSDYTPPQREL